MNDKHIVTASDWEGPGNAAWQLSATMRDRAYVERVSGRGAGVDRRIYRSLRQKREGYRSDLRHR